MEKERGGANNPMDPQILKIAPVSRTTGNIETHYQNWLKIYQNIIIFEIVKECLIPFHPGTKISKMVPQKFESLQHEIQYLINIGAISHCKSRKGEFLSPYFLREKLNSKIIFILNLKI